MKDKINKRMRIIKDNKGMSLVEIIVTFAVLAVMTGVVFANVLNQLQKAERAKALHAAEAIYKVAQIAIINASVDEPEAFRYAVKFRQNVNGNDMNLGRFSSQSLYKYLKESQGGPSLSSAKSKKADYYIAEMVAHSVPSADGEIEDTLLKDKSPVGLAETTAQIAANPGTYGEVVFALAYDENGQIVYFQCVYNGYFMYTEGRELQVEKVSDKTKFNNWPKTRRPEATGW